MYRPPYGALSRACAWRRLVPCVDRFLGTGAVCGCGSQARSVRRCDQPPDQTARTHPARQLQTRPPLSGMRLLTNLDPRRRNIEHRSPRHALADNVSQPVESFAQRMLPLGRSLVDRHHVSRNNRRFVAVDVRSIGPTKRRHTIL